MVVLLSPGVCFLPSHGKGGLERAYSTFVVELHR